MYRSLNLYKDISNQIIEMKELIESYFECNPIRRVLQELSDPKSFNFSTSEMIGISLSGYFDKDEPEYYGERKVQFCGYLMKLDDEVCGTISFENFVAHLKKHADEYILESPAEKESIVRYLEKIEKRLSL